MKVTLQYPASGDLPWLRVFQVDGPCEEVEDIDRPVDYQDRAEQDKVKAETFWAGRTLAMRHSARVAA